MVASVNRVILLGEIGRYGVEVRFLDSGQPCASFTLVLTECGQDARTHTTLVECQVFGKRAESAADLAPGALVVFEGKLSKRRRGETWETIVVGFEVTPVQGPVALAPLS